MRGLRRTFCPPHGAPALLRPGFRCRCGATPSSPLCYRKKHTNTSSGTADVRSVSSVGGCEWTGPQYHYIEDVEKLHRYEPGAYHPVTIGDQLNSRYRVVHKLGYGAYSTTWLARDTTRSALVAVKIARAASTSREVDVMRLLTQAQRELPPNAILTPSVIDSFNVSGPNGIHSCYVTQTASGSVNSAKEQYGSLLKIKVARAFAAQLVGAVALVHSCGLVHGDLHPGNVLIKLHEDLDGLSDEQLYEEYNEPEYMPVRRFDGGPLSQQVPSHAVSCIWLAGRSKKFTLRQARILLADFGEAFSPSQEIKTGSRAPTVYCPPEVFFEPDRPASFQTDIWTLACTIWDLLALSSPFNNFFGSRDDTICEQVDALGPLPPVWWAKWEARGDYFTEDGLPKGGREPFTLKQRFGMGAQHHRRRRGMKLYSGAEWDAIFAMLRPMFSYRPEDRPTIQEVLMSEWMQRWALPEYEKILKWS